MARYKKEREVAERDLQGRHEAEMAKLHDLMIELKAQMGAISVRQEPISESCEITQADNLNCRRRLSRKAQ